MIASANKKSFFAAHYELLVLAVGVLALVAGVLLAFMGGSEVRDSGQVPQIPADAPTGVQPEDMELYQYMIRVTKEPFLLPVGSDKEAGPFASERRIHCAECAAPISATAKICTVCNKAQPEEAKVVYDTDSDGLPDEWEKRYGLNINDANDAALDSDGDLFTNLEEFEMKTDPKDPKSHLPYSNYLRLELPLKETRLPFYFDSVTKLPSGYRFKFIDPVKYDQTRRRKGMVYTPLAGEEVVDGYVVKSYEQKSEKRKIAGGKGMEKTVDVSTATVVRQKDGKEMVLTVGDRRLQAVDTQATIVFDRGEGEKFDRVAGEEIDLKGEKYRVQSIRKEGKTVRVLLEHSTLGTKKLLEALEQ